MADPLTVAVVFGLFPLAAVLLYRYANRLAARPEVVWGVLVGALSFLGMSHAMTFVLASDAQLMVTAGEVGSFGLVLGGIAVGLGIGVLFLRRAEVGLPGWLPFASILFVALHSLNDGLVLGYGLVGMAEPSVPVDAVNASATLLHRFAEGALVVVPAIAASWSLRRSSLGLLAGLATIPAAFVPSALYGALPVADAFATTLAVMVFLAALEAGFAIMILLGGFVPRAAAGRFPRWVEWAGIGFLLLAAIHALVE